MFGKVTALAVVLSFAFATNAIASNENPFLGANLMLNWNGNQVWSMDLEPNDDSSTGTVSDMLIERENWDLELTNVLFDADPIISANAAVFNPTAMTQTFNLVFTMPVNFATGGATTQSGSHSITITDANGDSTVTMATSSPDPLYSAYVNGGLARTLFDDPYSLTASGFPGIGGSDTLNFPTEAGPAVGLLTELRLEYTFTLSPGDRATVNGAYFIIPEPASLSLLAFGAIAMIRRRR